MALTKISTAMISQSAAAVDLNVDAGTFYVDTTNNRVGVGGKTDPDTPLHVVGTVTATLFAGSGASLTNIPNSALTNSSITINSTAVSLGGSLTLTTANIAENTNLYYTNARADARIAAATTDDLSEGSSNLYYTDARVDARVSGGSLGNITTTGYIRGPATFTLDPAAHGDNTGTVVIAGNLQVDGTTTTINSTTMTVDDKNITLASGSANAAAASGAGFTVDIGTGTNPAITYDGTNDEWDFNKPLNVAGAITTSGNISKSSGNLTLDVAGEIILDADGGNVIFHDGGVNIGRITNDSSHLRIQSDVDDKDIIFRGKDGSSYITALTLDMSNAGYAIFNAGGSFTGDVTVRSGNKLILNRADNATGGEITYGPTGTGFIINDVNGDDTIFKTGSSEHMRIHSNGNVGIGTGSTALSVKFHAYTTGYPVAKFERYGSSAATRGWTQIGHSSLGYSGATGADTYIVAQHGFGIAVNEGTNAMTITDGGLVGIGTTSPSHVLDLGKSSGDVAIRLKTTTGGDPTIIFDSAAANRSGIIKYQDNGTNVGRIQYVHNGDRIDFQAGSATGATMSIENGKVGIGTSSPTMPLSVQAASNAYAISMHGRSDGYSELYGASNDGSTKYSFLQSHSAQTKLYTLVNTPLLLGTNSTERMRVTTTGNVEVRNGGSLRAYRAGNSAYAGLFMDAAEKLYIRNSWGVKDIVMLRTGEVGIGTDAPTAKLDIRGGSGAGTHTHAVFTAVTSRGAEIRTRSDISGGQQAGCAEFNSADSEGDGGDIALSSNGNPRMFIHGAGNVGIGTTDPTAKLHVYDAGGNDPSFRVQRGLDGGRIQFVYASNTTTGLGEIGQTYYGTGRTRIWMGANLESFSTGHSGPAQQDSSYGSWFSTWDSYADEFTVNRIASGNTSRLLVINANGSITTPKGGAHNVHLGENALYSVGSSSNYNTAIGKDALKANSAGNNGVAIGFEALMSDATVEESTAVGAMALRSQTSGRNHAFGFRALMDLTGGVYNTAVGGETLENVVNGGYNTAVGAFAGRLNQNGDQNTYIGYQSGYTNNGGDGNVALGHKAFYGSTSANNCIAIGRDSMGAAVTGDFNISIGRTSSNSMTSGTQNTSIGVDSLTSINTGSYNVAVGPSALRLGTGAMSNNTAVGVQSGRNTTSNNNVFLGYESGYSNTSGINTGIGHRTLRQNQAGTGNVAVGNDTMYYNNGGSYNVAVGNAANQAGSGSRNVHIGQQTGGYNTGTLITAVGNQAAEGLANNTNAGSYGTFIGAYAGQEINTGQVNNFFGYAAGRQVTTGGKNTIVGSYQGNGGNNHTVDIRTSSNNVVLSDGDANIRLRYTSDGHKQEIEKHGSTNFKHIKITKKVTCTGSSVTRHTIDLGSEFSASSAGTLRYEVSILGYASAGANALNAKYSVGGYSGHHYSSINYGSFGAGTIQNGYKSSNSTSYYAAGLSYHPCVNMGSYIASGEVYAYVPAAQQYGFTVSNDSSSGFDAIIIVEGWYT